MTELLLQTKYHIPNLPVEFVTRYALIEKINLIMQRKLCLIQTPAGYGKTMLAASWAKNSKKPVAWVSLDHGDNNFPRFYAYLITAIRRCFQEFAPGLLERLVSPRGMPHELFLTSFVNLLDKLQESLVIILDDYHLIHEVEIHESIQYLLDNLPASIHFFILSREELPLSIARLRAKDQLVEIKYSELRFSEYEAREFLNNKSGLSLEAKHIQMLMKYTEGWIVGLHLAAISLSDIEKPEGFLSGLQKSKQFAIEYLFEEVLQGQPYHIQSFLLETSVFDRFSASLCNQVMEISNSQSLIQEIYHSGLFLISLDYQQEWFRYHYQFAELLSSRANTNNPEKVIEINKKASVWYEENGFTEEAVEYALRARDYQYAAKLLEKIGKDLFWRGDPQQVLNWIDSLPTTIYFEYPSLWILHLWAHITLAQFSIASADLESLQHETIFSHITDEKVKAHYEASVATLKALIAINLEYDVARGLKYARTGIENFDPESMFNVMAPIIFGKACMLSGQLEAANSLLEKSSFEVVKQKSSFMKMIVTHHRAELSFFQGDLTKAEHLLQEAYQIGVEEHMDDASAFFRICIDIGRINYEKNDLAIARRFLTTGVKGGERALIAYDLLNGYCSLFEIAQIDRDASRTEQIIVDMENLARASGYSKPILERIDAMKARLAIRKRDLHYCRRWLASQDLDQGYPFYKLFEAETAIRTLVILKEHSQAIQLSEKVLEIVNQNQSLRDIVRFRSWLALIYYQSGNFQTALRVLQKAVRISAHQKYIRSILDVGAPIIDLLEELAHHPPPEWSSKPILDHLSVLIYDQKYQTEISYNDTTLFYGENLLEPLTDRENEVLGLLSKGHSNTDISEIMVISESTVKYHLKNIYLKLGVHNRTQAIVKAAEFHLLM